MPEYALVATTRAQAKQQKEEENDYLQKEVIYRAQPKSIEEAVKTSERLTEETEENWIAGLYDKLFEKGRVEEKKKLTRSEKRVERAEYRKE